MFTQLQYLKPRQLFINSLYFLRSAQRLFKNMHFANQNFRIYRYRRIQKVSLQTIIVQADKKFPALYKTTGFGAATLNLRICPTPFAKRNSRTHSLHLNEIFIILQPAVRLFHLVFTLQQMYRACKLFRAEISDLISTT